MALNNYQAADKYGRALFELASEQNRLDEIQKEVLELQKVFANVSGLGDILSNISLAEAQKQTILKDLLKDASDLVGNLIQLVYKNRRMSIMPLILTSFIEEYNQEKGIIIGQLTTSVPINQATKEKIAKSVATKFGIDNVELKEKVDEKIVGGVIVEANNLIIDGSVRTQLQKLRNLLNQ